MARACKPPALLKQSGRPFLPGGTPDDRQALLDSRKLRPDKNVIKRKIPALNEQVFSGDPCGNRTHVNGVRGRCLNRLTNGPYKKRSRHLPIFTGRFQPTIVGTSELNYCVRNGNRWDLTVIDTGRIYCHIFGRIFSFLEVYTLKTE